MIKTLIRVMYSAFISIILISMVLAGWTTYSLFFQTSKSSDIVKVMQDMYVSQKSVITDVIDLTKILIKDTSEKIASEDNNLLTEAEFLTDQEDKSLFDKQSILEDNGDNPLGIIIQPTLPEVSGQTFPEINEESLIDEQSEVSINEMEMEMNSLS